MWSARREGYGSMRILSLRLVYVWGIGRSLSNSVFAGISYGSRHGSPDSSELVGRYPRENAETDLKEASEAK